VGVKKPTITYWVREARKGRLSLVGTAKKALSETEIELARVKRELAQVVKSAQPRTPFALVPDSVFD